MQQGGEAKHQSSHLSSKADTVHKPFGYGKPSAKRPFEETFVETLFGCEKGNTVQTFCGQWVSYCENDLKRFLFLAVESWPLLHFLCWTT